MMQNYLKEVREQYEELPYPPCDPEDEKKRLMGTNLDGLDRINHYCFAGKNGFNNGFRALVAGGGTGGSAIFLAEQLRDKNAEIVYLDMSAASLAIAKKRAELRGLRNITWVNDSLLNIPHLDLGKFDYINCSGVLHHLENPDAGLAALKAALKEDGAMGIMLYAPYGRAGIYHIQQLMRLVNSNEHSTSSKLENCKKLLAQIPQNSWFAQLAAMFKGEFRFGDAGIYDLFLHSQDRSYSVDELYEFVENCGLKIVKLFGNTQPQGNQAYDPSVYIKDPDILEKVMALNIRKQQAIAENINGLISQQVFYIKRKQEPEADINNLDNVPFLSIVHGDSSYGDIYDMIKKSSGILNIQKSVDGNNLGFSMKKGSHTDLFFKYLDGVRTTGEIISSISASGVFVGEKSLLEEFKNIYKSFNNFNWMFLRDRSVPAFQSIEAMQRGFGD